MATPSNSPTITTAPTDFPVLPRGPAGADIESASSAQSRPPSPCSPLLESESISSSYTSDSSANKWTPAGVYVPIHRRGGSGSSTATSVSSSPRSSKLARANFPLVSSHSAFTMNRHPRPRPRKYTRVELLSLASTSLVQASLHPTITPQLIAKHPRILRARGEGVFRALEMVRQDLYRDYFASVSASANKNVHTNATMNDSEMRRTHRRVPWLATLFSNPTSPGSGGPPQPDTHPAPTPIPGPNPSPDPSRSRTPSPSSSPTRAQSNKAGGRARCTHRCYQRNCASVLPDATMASYGRSSSQPTVTVAAAPTASATTVNATAKINESAKPDGDSDANLPINSHSASNRMNRAVGRRQVRTGVKPRDVSAISSWRSPLSQSLSQALVPAQAGTITA